MATEKRLIDVIPYAEELRLTIVEARMRFCNTPVMQEIIDLLEIARNIALNSPAVDAVEVVHGHWFWKPTNEWTSILTCSVCGSQEGTCESYKYCPNCGAKMDLKED